MKSYPLLLALSLLLGACGSETSQSGGAAISSKVETIGFIEGSLDGEARKWFITRAEFDGELVSQSDWQTMFNNHATINLFGHPSDTTALQSTGALMVNIDAMNLDQTPTLSDQEVVYLAGGMTKAYTSDADGGSAAIVIDNIAINGDTLTVSGTVEARMHFRNPFNPSAEAPAQTVSVLSGGRFEATLAKQGR